MSKNIIKSLDTMENWLKRISETNDSNVDQTDNLNIVLVNLKLEDARIKDNTGIVPIAQEIEKVIHNIHDNTDELRKTGRTELRAAFKDIKEYIEQAEGVK